MSKAVRAAAVALATLVPVGLGCSLLTDLSGLRTGAGAEGGSGLDGADATIGDAPDDALAETGTAGLTFTRRVSVANVANVPLPANHPVCFQVPAPDVTAALAAGKVRADLGDMRVFGPTGERSRAVDQRGAGAVAVCFRLERPIATSATDDGYSISYGAKALPPPVTADEAVFDFFDGFDGTVLGSRWVSEGAPVVGGGRLTLPKGTNEPAITTTASSDGIPVVASLEMRARVVDPSSAGNAGGDFYWLGFQRGGDFVADLPFTVFYGGTNTVTTWHGSVSGPCSSVCQDPVRAQSSAFRVYRIDRHGDAARFTFDDDVKRDKGGPTGDLSVMIRSFLVASDIEVDWVRARPLIWPEPNVMLGAESAL